VQHVNVGILEHTFVCLMLVLCCAVYVINLKINFQHFLFLGIAQVASEGMDDTRMDLTQLEESGTGRSVPTTPLQVSPQGMQCSL